MADNQYSYSTGYPGMSNPSAPAQGANQFVNYPQWNAQGTYANPANPYSQPPPTAPTPAGYPQAFNQPPPSFPQAQPPPSQGNLGSNNQYGSKENQYNRSGGGGGSYSNRSSGYDSGGERNSGGRSGGGSFNSGSNRGDYAKGPVETRTGDLIVQQDTIFISGMDPHTSESQIVQHFGAIGIIKIDKKTNKPKVWMYTDKQTGRPKGEATVTFEDPFTASSAIEWFDGKDFNGNTIAVQLASRRDNWQGGKGGRGGGGGGGGRGGRGRGGGPPREDRDYDDGGRGGYGSRDDEDNGYGRDRDFGGRGGGFRGRGGGGFKDRDGGRGGRGGERQGGYGGREGDWKCPNSECGNTNFSWRQQCNRCNESKPGGTGGGDSDRRGGGGRGGGGRGGFGGGGGSRGRGGGGAMRNDYSNNRNRPY